MRKVESFLAAAILATLTILAGSARAGASSDPGTGEWPTLGNGPGHSGYYPKTIGSGTFAPVWSKTFTNIKLNQAAISGSMVYLTTDGYYTSGMRAFALDAASGAEIWSYSLGKSFAISAPSYWNGRVYFQQSGQLICLSASTGSLVWNAPYSDQGTRTLAPTVTDSSVLFNGGMYGGLYSFNALSGTQQFFISRPWENGWTPSYASGVVYSSVESSFMANSTSTSSQLSDANLETSTQGTRGFWPESAVPAISGSQAAIVCAGRIVTMNLLSHQPDWYISGNYAGIPAFAGGIIYAILGDTVQACLAESGEVVGTYTAGPGLTGQPIVTKDSLLVASGSNTYVFDLGSYELRQTLPTGGWLSYAAGKLYTVSNNTVASLAAYSIDPAEDDPAISSTVAPDPVLQSRANPARTLAAASAPWLDCQRSAGVAYFLFDSPAKIERYNLNTQSWLAPISLPDGPTAFTVGKSGIAVAFGKAVSAFALSGTTETPLATNAEDIRCIREVSGNLYAFSDSQCAVYATSTGRLLQTFPLPHSLTGLSTDLARRRLFARTSGTSASPITELALAEDGTIAFLKESSEHGGGSNAPWTKLTPGASRVVDESGLVGSTADLSDAGSLGAGCDDLDFAGTSPVVLRGQTLVGYRPTLEQAGQVNLTTAPSRILVAGTNVVSFQFQADRGVAESLTPLDSVLPPEPMAGVDPAGLRYIPDAIELGTDEIFLLCLKGQSVFRWSVSQRRYLPSISLSDSPLRIAYSKADNRLYLSYTGGRIGKVDLDSGLAESTFATATKTAKGLAMTGEFLFAEAGGLFSSSGNLVNSAQPISGSPEYIWNPVYRRLYCIQSGLPNSLAWVGIDQDGNFFANQNSSASGVWAEKNDPLRISEDGTKLVVANGDLYDAQTLTRTGTLGIGIVDARWTQGNLYSLEGTTISGSSSNWPYAPIYTAGRIRARNSALKTFASAQTDGRPMQVFATDDCMVTVSVVNGIPQFARFGFDVSKLSADPPTQPWSPIVVTTLEPTSVQCASVQFNGKVENGDVLSASFQWGTTTSYGHQLSGTLANELRETTVTASATGLEAGKTYHYRLVATGTAGLVTGSDCVFQTLSSGTVTARTQTGVTLSGSIASGYSEVHFEWGTGTSYSNSTPANFVSSSDGFDSLSAELTGLTPGTLYRFRIVAQYPGTGSVSLPSVSFVTVFPERDLTIFVTDSVRKPVSLNLLAGLEWLKPQLSGLATPSLGDIFMDSGNQLIYVPRTLFRNFSGFDSLFYRLDDGYGGEITGKVTLLNPYYPRRGTYSATFSGGSLAATVTSAGTLSGKLLINAKTIGFSGAFDQNAAFSKTVGDAKTGTFPLTINLDLEAAPPTLSAMVDGTAVTLHLTTPLKQGSVHSGQYTVCFPPDDTQLTRKLPQGVGYGFLSVTEKGTSKMVGKLADGTPFSASAPLASGSAGDSVSFAINLPYANAGSLSGTLVFADELGQDCSGLMTWNKPAQTKGMFLGGFTLHSQAFGARYAKPGAYVSPLVFADSSPNAQLTCSEGNLSSDQVTDLTVSYNNKFRGFSLPSLKLQIAIDPGTGYLHGSFIHPDLGKRVTFQGVVNHKLGSAFGYFLGTTESGWVWLTEK